MRRIRDAFHEIHDGYSADRVVADPDLNVLFVAACRSRGLHDSEAVLNQRLLNLRKRGELGVKTTAATRFDDDEYRFAAEIAIRHLERRDHVTLDDVLVNPALAHEFDALCQIFAPGYSSLEYRWSALRLRKTRGLAPEIVGHVIPADDVLFFGCHGVEIDSMPMKPGIYIFVSNKSTLYVGAAANLRTRLRKHLDHSDNKQLAQWFWQQGMNLATMELHVLNENVPTKMRKAIELELIKSRKPLFNIFGRSD